MPKENPYRPFTPEPDQMARHPGVSGNDINGLGETEMRLPKMVYWAPGPDDIPHISPDHNLAGSRLNLAVGGAETDEFIRQTADFHNAWTAAGGTGEHLVAGDKNHFSVIDGLADPRSELFALLSRMVGVV